MSDDSICPCEGFIHPAPAANPPGRAHVHYRAGDFRSFRRALLQRAATEKELAPWLPNGRGDLLLQIPEWWAYVADVLTLYNERSLNESLLGTATLDESVRSLIRILGYRPRPGIAASAKIGALLGGKQGLSLAAGFAVDSKPAPGKQPQTYETTAPISFSLPDAVPAQPPSQLAGASGQLYLQGTITNLKADDFLILVQNGLAAGNGLLLQVAATHSDKDAVDAAFTEITLKGSPSLPTAAAAGYRLLRSQRSSGLWKFYTTTNLIASPVELEGVDRTVKAGDPFLLTALGTGLSPVLRSVSGTSESVWYANGNGSSTSGADIPIGLPHTRVSYSNWFSSTNWDLNRDKVKVLLDWEPAGTLRDRPMASFSGAPLALVATTPQLFRVGDDQTVLIEDADGRGALAKASVAAGTPGQLQIVSFLSAAPTAAAPLKAPFKVLHNVIEIGHGKSVAAEILGSGDATLAGQSFALKKSPLTYLPAGDRYKSTLKVYVNGVAWTEVENFYGQPPNAPVFVTREDDEQKTHVTFGDGTNGARLPTGHNNVVAWYRFGSGADAPAAGALTVIAKPYPGLRSLRHPVAGGGGSDPDPASQIRRYAPRSVLTFGRAISADDYEAIASRAPGVARVRAIYGWDAQDQRATVKLHVGDDQPAVDSAREALRLSADPNRTVSVLPATPVPLFLAVLIRVSPDRITADVVAQVREALLDPDYGLVGANRIRIGESIYFSQLSAACLSVPGVESLPLALFLMGRPDPVTGLVWALSGWHSRITVAEGEFFQSKPQWVAVFPEAPVNV
jgi:hypothetical protein